MRMSCNGCRALRKGCSDDCSIRHCLQWIKSAESQANATLFLSKFYGRAGLMNLVNSGSEERRPAIFRSLLYEACGRKINPVYGSAGLLWSGDWHLCQAGVEAVLKGSPIKPVSSDPGGVKPTGYIPETTTSSCDIRHVSKEATASLQVFGQHAAAGSANANLRKRSGGNGGSRVSPDAAHSYRLFKKLRCSRTKFQKDQGRASCLSQDSGESGDSSMVTTQVADPRKDDCNLELELDLTLGIRP